MSNRPPRILLVDAGNSRLKCALLSDGQRTVQQAYSYSEYLNGVVPDKGQAAVGQVALQILRDCLQEQQVQGLVGVQVLGVAFAAQLAQLCAEYHCSLHLADSAAAHYGLQLGYAQPAQLGADRLVGLVAARQLAQGQAAILVDCGTAVTVDALDGQGRHHGGLILPGLQLLGEALIRRAQAQHMNALDFTEPGVFADNTWRGMGSGCLFALVGAIEGICRRMQAQLAEPVQVILCGGDAERVWGYLDGEFLLEPEALMIGLQVIAEEYVCTPC
ncbi:MAG: type III pantothenate kinase [Thiolinea sp.]